MMVFISSRKLHVSAYSGHLQVLTALTLMWAYPASVGMITNYGLDGPGSNPDGEEIFHPSRQALGTTKPPV